MQTKIFIRAYSRPPFHIPLQTSLRKPSSLNPISFLEPPSFPRSNHELTLCPSSPSLPQSLTLKSSADTSSFPSSPFSSSLSSSSSSPSPGKFAPPPRTSSAAPRPLSLPSRRWLTCRLVRFLRCFSGHLPSDQVTRTHISLTQLPSLSVSQFNPFRTSVSSLLPFVSRSRSSLRLSSR